ncbi:MAG: chromosome segregation protein SMC [Pirellulaceae bacterium]|nr:chromosome segregation protein SMC [Pirellulaceae bacterium]
MIRFSPRPSCLSHAQSDRNRRFQELRGEDALKIPPGITVVVGPNGSGKSNIVDGLKWVLGEQSVKSLRGKEMADVIFNGSSSRRATNSAEITITFDNSSRLLPIESPEVHITRRVYRSGEGEYLINRQPSRLRDIRQLLSGTGMGTQAYSVIEQGKVDVLLQSSPRDRRLIFEEAAGISLFKSKKLEALRRLERVEQNLLRLSDIVDEVESRLRSIRLQAGKARRYKEYNDRLQELRTQVAMVDWRRLSERLAAIETELAELERRRESDEAESQVLEVAILDVETESERATESIRSAESRIAANRERIAARESTLAHERRRSRDLEREAATLRGRLAQMTVRAGDLRQQANDTAEACEDAQRRHQEIARRATEGERRLTDSLERLDRLRGEHKQREAAYLEQMAVAAEWGNRASALESRAASAEVARQQYQKRLEELQNQRETLARQHESLGREAETLGRRVAEREEGLASARGELDSARARAKAAQEELAERVVRHGTAVQRISVLEDLQRRQEGVGAGVKQVLGEAHAASDGPFRQVLGLVADLLHVSVEAAPVIEVALGEKAEQIVLAEAGEIGRYLQDHSHRLAGRVGFVALDRLDSDIDRQTVDLHDRPGVLGRADRFVESEPRCAPLVRRLLGRTWVVENLADALRLAESAPRGLRFVTLAGELIEADGSIAAGPSHVAVGLIARRSELRQLASQQTALEEELVECRQRAEECERRVQRRKDDVRRLEQEHRQLLDARGQLNRRIDATDERRAEVDRQCAVRESERDDAARQHEEAVGALAEVQTGWQTARAALVEMEREVVALDRRVEEVENERRESLRSTTEVKVELAKSEEQLHNLKIRLRQFEESQQERQRVLTENRQQMANCLQQARQSAWTILQAESEIAELYLHKEQLAAKTVEFVNRRNELAARKAEAAKNVQYIRSRIRKLEETIHARELAAGEIRHERNTLADRLREDYQIELSQLEIELNEEEQHRREEVQQEIDELRAKINNLGNVNLEALAELKELDERHQHLSGQYQDLTSAKNELLRIVERINSDSRRLFSDTLETVRGHFQQLFRDLFGGGQADIVLEDEVDILESGIEIVARPPGKEPRNISLLSGGEKTLTCVALLLAIFRSRPSPFCVLDEVDAALDEANIGRFTEVLQDFLTWTQFIIVTHSKKTMACANTIYGVTMQESGISKRVSVSFEDVSEDGRILPSALRRANEQAQRAVDDEQTKDEETQAA